jgi:hypothetical protein
LSSSPPKQRLTARTVRGLGKAEHRYRVASLLCSQSLGFCERCGLCVVSLSNPQACTNPGGSLAGHPQQTSIAIFEKEAKDAKAQNSNGNGTCALFRGSANRPLRLHHPQLFSAHRRTTAPCRRRCRASRSAAQSNISVSYLEPIEFETDDGGARGPSITSELVPR